MNVTQLKTELKKRGLPVSGTKQQLEARLTPELEFEKRLGNRTLSDGFWKRLTGFSKKQKPHASVVCVKVASIRPEYSDLEKWMADRKNVYIGRQGPIFIRGERYPKEGSIWHNPFTIGKTGKREDVIEKYKEYILRKVAQDPKNFNLEKLKGKRLGCWCAPEGCHGDVLVELLNLWEAYWLLPDEDSELSYSDFFREYYEWLYLE